MADQINNAIGPDGKWYYDPGLDQSSGVSNAPAAAAPVDKSSWQIDDTSPIIDRDTGLRVRVDQKQLDDLVRQGAVGYSQERSVNVVDKDGNRFAVKGDHLRQALDSGARIETEFEKGVKDYVKSQDGSDGLGNSGAARVFLQNMTDEFLFGIPDAIENKDLSEYEKAKKQALKDAHQTANVIGGLVGFAGNVALTAGIGGAKGGVKAAQVGGKIVEGAQIAGKAAEAVEAAKGIAEAGKVLNTAEKVSSAAKLTEGLVAQGMTKVEATKVAESIVSKIAKGALKEGVNGALYAAPRAVTEAALGDPDTAAESLLIGFGAGAALGGVGKTLSEGSKWAAPKLAQAAEGIENKAIIDSLFHSSNKAGRRDIEKVGEDYVAQLIKKEVTSSGEKLQQKLSESAEDYAERFLQHKKDVGKELGNTLDKLQSFGTIEYSPEAIARQLQDEIIKPLEGQLGKSREVAKLKEIGTEFLQQHATELENGFASKTRPIGPRELFDKIKEVDNLIYREGRISETNTVKKELEKFRMQMVDTLEKGISNAEKEGKIEGGILDKYRSDKKKYQAMSVVGRVLEDEAIKASSNSAVSLTDALIGYGPGITALASGNVLGAVKGIAAGAANKLRREKGSLAVAKLIGWMGGMGSKGLVDAAVQGGDKAGILMAEKAMADVGYKLDTIPGIINTMGMVGKRAVVIKAIDKDTLQAINDLLADPKAMQNNIDQLSGIVGDTGAPTVAKLYAQKQLSALNYIKENAPSQPLHDPYKRVQGDASVIDKAKFTRKLEVLGNPYSVLDHLEKGTLTREHVEALSANYPKLKDAIVQKIIEHENSGKMAPVGSQYRAQIEMLKGNASNNNVQFFQDMHAASAKSAKGKKMGAGQLKLTASTHMTDMDRINYKGIGRK